MITANNINSNRYVTCSSASATDSPLGAYRDLTRPGLYSDDPQTPVTAVLSFFPPIAPKEHPEFRDEALLYEETSTRIAQLRDDMQAAEQRAE